MLHSIGFPWQFNKTKQPKNIWWFIFLPKRNIYVLCFRLQDRPPRDWGWAEARRDLPARSFGGRRGAQKSLDQLMGIQPWETWEWKLPPCIGFGGPRPIILHLLHGWDIPGYSCDETSESTSPVMMVESWKMLKVSGCGGTTWEFGVQIQILLTFCEVQWWMWGSLTVNPGVLGSCGSF